MAARELGTPAANQPLAQRAALMTRAHKREVDSEALRENWEKQAVDLGFDARALAAEAIAKGAVSPDMGKEAVREASHANEARSSTYNNSLTTPGFAWPPVAFRVRIADGLPDGKPLCWTPRLGGGRPSIFTGLRPRRAEVEAAAKALGENICPAAATSRRWRNPRRSPV